MGDGLMEQKEREDLLKHKILFVNNLMDKILNHMEKKKLSNLSLTPEELTELLPLLMFCGETLGRELRNNGTE